MILSEVKINNGSIILAMQSNIAVGCLCGWIAEDEDVLLLEDARRHGYISDIFIIEELRGQNLASILISGFEDKMIESGIRRIRICSKSANQSAIKSYNKNGFLPYEIIFEKEL